MSDKSKFEIKVPYPGNPIPVKIGFVAPRGTAVAGNNGVDGDSVLDGKLASVADGFIGFLTRNVTAAGEVGNVLNSVYGGRLEGDFKVNEICAVEKADALEVEGDDYILAGDGESIGAGTALGTALNFKEGKLKVAAAGENAYYRLTAKNLDPVVDGALRIRVDAIR